MATLAGRMNEAETARATPEVGPKHEPAVGAVSQLRVALLTNFVPPYRRPLYRVLAEKLRALQVFVATEMEPNRRWPVDWRGLDVVKMRGLTLTRRARHPHAFEEALFVHLPLSTLRDLWRAKPDVVLSGQLGLSSLWAALYRRLRPRSALVLWLTVSEASELGRGALRRWLRRRLVAFADAVIVNGASGRRYVRGLGVDDAAIFEAPYTTDLTAFAARADAAERDTRRLLYVGSGEPRKGLGPFLHELARVASQRSDEPIRLCVVGTEERAVADAPTALPDNLRVEWRGHLDYEEVPEAYAASGVLVFPTLADEWGLVVNEALAAGLPVLGSAYSQAVEELVEEGATGWRFRPDRRAEMRAAIERALDVDDANLERMRVACRERVAPLGYDAVAERMLAAIAWARRSGIEG